MYSLRIFSQVFFVVSLFALLVVAPGAAASSRDRNGDRIPDRWEVRHKLSLRVDQSSRDQDRDGLNNLGEFKSRTDPRDSDSDGDGVEDGEENVGRILSFDGTTLTISLMSGSEVSGLVTSETEIRCEQESDDGDDADDGSSSGSGDDQGDDGDDNGGPDHGDRSGRHHGDDDDEDGSCTTADLVEGAPVHEAEVELTADGLIFKSVKLIK